MIGNFSKHLKEQNWLGLFLDFVVVVLGIFLGLQAADWNQSRLDEKEANYHLRFLYNELSDAMDSTAEEIEQSEGTLRQSFEASRLLHNETWGEHERERFETTVYSTFELWGPKYRPISLRRIVDDGKLDLIESKDLQNAILQYDTAFRDAIEQTRTSYSFSLYLTPKITSSIRFNGPAIVSTTQELLNSQELRAAVRDKAIWQRIQLGVLYGLQDARGVLKDVLTASAVARTNDSSQ